MLSLANAVLRVDVLDPVADAARLGPRFCWGGYLWQVHDTKAGPLLSGPEWPSLTPAPFNGQGLPESFRHRTLEGRPLTWRGDRGVALGAGELALAADGTVTLETPCKWEIVRHVDRLVFTTQHAAARFRYELTRMIELTDREVRSITRLTNLADERLVLEWFAHPFFTLHDDGLASAEFPEGSVLPDNPGFVLNGRALTQKRRFTVQTGGHFERGLRLPADQPLTAKLAHPKLTHVTFETSFAPDASLLWGNDRTFSIEPYLTLDLAPGETRQWSLCYRFGAPR